MVTRLGGGQRLRWTRVWRSSELASHHTRALPDLWLTIDGSERSTAYACRAIATSSVPTWLELDIWLARSLLRYAALNLSMENQSVAADGSAARPAAEPERWADRRSCATTVECLYEEWLDSRAYDRGDSRPASGRIG